MADDKAKAEMEEIKHRTSNGNSIEELIGGVIFCKIGVDSSISDEASQLLEKLLLEDSKDEKTMIELFSKSKEKVEQSEDFSQSDFPGKAAKENKVDEVKVPDALVKLETPHLWDIETPTELLSNSRERKEQPENVSLRDRFGKAVKETKVDELEIPDTLVKLEASHLWDNETPTELLSKSSEKTGQPEDFSRGDTPGKAVKETKVDEVKVHDTPVKLETPHRLDNETPTELLPKSREIEEQSEDIYFRATSERVVKENMVDEVKVPDALVKLEAPHLWGNETPTELFSNSRERKEQPENVSLRDRFGKAVKETKFDEVKVPGALVKLEASHLWDNELQTPLSKSREKEEQSEDSSGIAKSGKAIKENTVDELEIPDTLVRLEALSICDNEILAEAMSSMSIERKGYYYGSYKSLKAGEKDDSTQSNDDDCLTERSLASLVPIFPPKKNRRKSMMMPEQSLASLVPISPAEISPRKIKMMPKQSDNFGKPSILHVTSRQTTILPKIQAYSHERIQGINIEEEERDYYMSPSVLCLRAKGVSEYINQNLEEFTSANEFVQQDLLEMESNTELTVTPQEIVNTPEIWELPDINTNGATSQLALNNLQTWQLPDINTNGATSQLALNNLQTWQLPDINTNEATSQLALNNIQTWQLPDINTNGATSQLALNNIQTWQLPDIKAPVATSQLALNNIQTWQLPDIKAPGATSQLPVSCHRTMEHSSVSTVGILSQPSTSKQGDFAVPQACSRKPILYPIPVFALVFIGQPKISVKKSLRRIAPKILNKQLKKTAEETTGDSTNITDSQIKNSFAGKEQELQQIVPGNDIQNLNQDTHRNLARQMAAMPSLEELKRTDKDKDNYLHIAACNDNWLTMQDILETLAREGLSGLINERNLQGQTPLYLAVCMNNAKMVELLIEHGADVNMFADLEISACTSVKLAAIHNVSTKGDKFLNTLQALLKAQGIDLNLVNSNGHTALICAILAHGKVSTDMPPINSIPMIQALIHAGADPTLPVQQTGKIALMYALESRDLDLIEKTCELVDPSKLATAFKIRAFDRSFKSFKSSLDKPKQTRLSRCLRKRLRPGTSRRVLN